MSRKLMAILVSSAVAFGSVSISAWSAPDISNNGQIQAVKTADVAKNQSPLPPAGAAGIKQAQGFVDFPFLTIAIGLGAIAILWILLDEDDDDDTVSSTGT